MVDHSFVERLAAWSLRARSAKRSNFPRLHITLKLAGPRPRSRSRRTTHAKIAVPRLKAL